jgi:hypothetical protein
VNKGSPPDDVRRVSYEKFNEELLYTIKKVCELRNSYDFPFLKFIVLEVRRTKEIMCGIPALRHVSLGQ